MLFFCGFDERWRSTVTAVVAVQFVAVPTGLWQSTMTAVVAVQFVAVSTGPWRSTVTAVVTAQVLPFRLVPGIGVWAIYIHLGGQTEFWPNGKHKLFSRGTASQGEKNNNELLQSLFFTVVE